MVGFVVGILGISHTETIPRRLQPVNDRPAATANPGHLDRGGIGGMRGTFLSSPASLVPAGKMLRDGFGFAL
jgi:hypothetical protein